MQSTTVGTTCLLDRMTFAATGAYTLTGSTVAIRIWTGRIGSPSFVIEKTDEDDSVTWDVSAGDEGLLDVDILPADWLGEDAEQYTPREDTTFGVQVQITLATGGVKRAFFPMELLVLPTGMGELD